MEVKKKKEFVPKKEKKDSGPKPASKDTKAKGKQGTKEEVK